MHGVIYCKTISKGKQAFYVKVGKESYYLFTQNYRRSNRNVFSRGVRINDLRKNASSGSCSVRATVDKLPAYLQFIEKEYNVNIFEKRNARADKHTKPYKRIPFRLRDYYEYCELEDAI